MKKTNLVAVAGLLMVFSPLIALGVMLLVFTSAEQLIGILIAGAIGLGFLFLTTFGIYLVHNAERIGRGK